jgi:hypothetical protein
MCFGAGLAVLIPFFFSFPLSCPVRMASSGLRIPGGVWVGFSLLDIGFVDGRGWFGKRISGLPLSWWGAGFIGFFCWVSRKAGISGAYALCHYIWLLGL